jgi:hypothetical protein
MDTETVYVARPVENQPKSKWYRYVKRSCCECGFRHLYRKVAERKQPPVRYGCVKGSAMQNKGKQERLFGCLINPITRCPKNALH